MNLLFISNTSGGYSQFKEFLSSLGFQAFYSSEKGHFYPLIREKGIRIVVLDLTGEKSKIQNFLKTIKDFDPLLEIIVAGVRITSFEMIEFIKSGASDYLIKPLTKELILPVLEKIKKKMLLRTETYILEKELGKKYFFQGIVGKSPYMLEIFSIIERVAKYDIPVFITGETGTGKELVAQAIHNLSPQKNNKLVICDCTAIPETLFESELFGYAKGAFTGANKSKDGIFKDADEGTIFLDEIGEIPLMTQKKLLRVLQERQFRPLGTTENIKINFRIISASNRNLRKYVAEGNFREDLFHRINVIKIQLPALRERKEDILLLNQYFLEKFNQKFDKKVLGISQRAKKVFLQYSWPGNIRELENSLERAVMLCQEKFVDINDLPDNMKELTPGKKRKDHPSSSQFLSLDEIEKNYIVEIIKEANNNKQMAAKILGLSRPALYRKLKKYNIPFK